MKGASRLVPVFADVSNTGIFPLNIASTSACVTCRSACRSTLQPTVTQPLGMWDTALHTNCDCDGRLVCELLHLLQPHVDLLEALLRCGVIREQHCLCASVERRCDCAESLLSCRDRKETAGSSQAHLPPVSHSSSTTLSPSTTSSFRRKSSPSACEASSEKQSS